MTTRSAGSTSRSSHSGGGAGVKPRGGDGSAAMVPLVLGGFAVVGRFGGISSRALAASSAMSSSTSPSPPVRSTLIGSRGRGDLGLDVAQAEQHRGHLVGGVRRHTGLFDRTDDRVVVAHQPGALGPADQRVRQAETRCAHDDSALHRVTTASSADLASP